MKTFFLQYIANASTYDHQIDIIGVSNNVPHCVRRVFNLTYFSRSQRSFSANSTMVARFVTVTPRYFKFDTEVPLGDP